MVSENKNIPTLKVLERLANGTLNEEECKTIAPDLLEGLPQTGRRKGGRPKGSGMDSAKYRHDTKALAKDLLSAATLQAARVLVKNLKNKKGTVSQAAAMEILNRTLGKPTENIAAQINEKKAITLTCKSYTVHELIESGKLFLPKKLDVDVTPKKEKEEP